MKEAFDSFIRNDQTLAQPFTLEKNVVHTRPIVRREGPQDSFQSKLNLLDDVLDPKIPLYLLLRRRDSIFAITFVPYRAFKDENEMYLRYRHELVQLLGDEHIKTSLICKEVGEITDARSWVERETRQQEKEVDECTDGCEDSHEHTHTKDAGYKKNKCRLCDRRMKNKITDQALEALGKLGNVGNLVQVVSLHHNINQISSTDRSGYLVLGLQPCPSSRLAYLRSPTRAGIITPPHNTPNIYILPPQKQAPLLHLPFARYGNRAAANEAHNGYPWSCERPR